eukprot:CAMPEP_0195127892 /NCGR_PEP_ID=MMETSP0448-20130528/138019_1 /TAXON_ID=66468 /ORGANISM="Heterocapsa triquestra, Strain CCMP 448" /LENGTH=78 /DNA_ID=CAMNT_0040165669 /DNA_START=42 /DNA_END=275 /DNA_ORIENTATION=-
MILSEPSSVSSVTVPLPDFTAGAHEPSKPGAAPPQQPPADEASAVPRIVVCEAPAVVEPGDAATQREAWQGETSLHSE